MMMTYGLFVFGLSTAAYQELQRQTDWRHVSQSRVNARPVHQYLGPGDDTINLTGTLLPMFTGGQQNLDMLRALADGGRAWPLIEGTGTYYGMFSITSLQERKSEFFRDGAAKQIEFDLKLTRIDDNRTELIGVLQSSMLRAITGAIA
ncbi:MULTISPECIES: phage tail protein [unclassified Halomonas]|uniref:phage tail protein n=1 Tax=unclassified Halomonas TaxID=2609666 RepID=UPI000990774C|nr:MULTISPECIES: phage tail protein [unclassified Halomonas]AQU84915.1 oxidoreductase [Halomonas sp. 'Soap Lake \